MTWAAPSATGQVRIRLTVTDDGGETTSATIPITVGSLPPLPPLPPPLTQPPTVSVTADRTSIVPGVAVLLTATASDPDGGEVPYSWSARLGSFDAADGASATWTAPLDSGSVEIGVTVTDDEGEAGRRRWPAPSWSRSRPSRALPRSCWARSC